MSQRRPSMEDLMLEMTSDSPHVKTVLSLIRNNMQKVQHPSATPTLPLIAPNRSLPGNTSTSSLTFSPAKTPRRLPRNRSPMPALPSSLPSRKQRQVLHRWGEIITRAFAGGQPWVQETERRVQAHQRPVPATPTIGIIKLHFLHYFCRYQPLSFQKHSKF